MPTHPYRDDSNGAMVLSLETSFYNSQHHHQYYTGHGIFQEHQSSQIPPMSEDEIPCLKPWLFDHQQGNSNSNPSPGMGCGDLQSLSLSMSPGSQSSCVTVPRQISPPTDHQSNSVGAAMESSKKRLLSEKLGGHKQTVHRKSLDTFGQRTSQYRGVTRSFIISFFFLSSITSLQECPNLSIMES